MQQNFKQAKKGYSKETMCYPQAFLASCEASEQEISTKQLTFELTDENTMIVRNLTNTDYRMTMDNDHL